MQLGNSAGSIVKSLCPPESQVGSTDVRFGFGLAAGVGPVPIFDVVPPPGAPARFGFNVAGSVVILDAHLRSSGDYGLTVGTANAPEGLPIAGSSVTIWGNPASDAPTRWIALAWGNSSRGKTAGPVQAKLRTLPSCASRQAARQKMPGLPFSARCFLLARLDRSALDSQGHQPKGFPYSESDWGNPQGPTGCAKVRSAPRSQSARPRALPTARRAFQVDLSLRKATMQTRETAPDLQEAVITLPQGMAVNPAAAAGQGACILGPIGLLTQLGATPIHFDEEPANCPDSSKIGTAEVGRPARPAAVRQPGPRPRRQRHPRTDRRLQSSSPSSSTTPSSPCLPYLAFEDPERGIVVKLPR